MSAIYPGCKQKTCAAAAPNHRRQTRPLEATQDSTGEDPIRFIRSTWQGVRTHGGEGVPRSHNREHVSLLPDLPHGSCH